MLSFQQGLLPHIIIYKNDGTTNYSFNPLLTPPVFDFRLSRATFKPAFDATGGLFEMKIMGTSPGATNTLFSNIAEGFDVVVGVGKDTSTLTELARYTIETIRIQEDKSTELMYLYLNGWDWGTDLLNGRMVDISVTQNKQPDGVTPDLADKKTKFFNLRKLLLGSALNTGGQPDKSAYPGDNLNITSRRSAVDQGLIVSDANIYPGNENDGKAVPEFETGLQRLNDALSRIDAMDGTTHFVNSSKEFITAPPYGFDNIWDSGILITDDQFDPLVNSPTFPNYNPLNPSWGDTKYGLIRSFEYIRSLENHRLRYFSLGRSDSKVDQTFSSATSFRESNASQYIAMRIKPVFKHCDAIAVFVIRAGTGWTTADQSPRLEVLLQEEDDSAGLTKLPNGHIVMRDTKLPLGIPTDFVNFHYFAVNQDLNTAKNHWIVIPPTNDSTRYFEWGRATASGLPPGTILSATSADGDTWTNSGSFAYPYRTTYSQALLDISNSFPSATAKHFWEEVFQVPTLSHATQMSAYVNTQLQTQGKRKETVVMNVVPPDVLLQPGMAIRVRKQLSGYNIDADGSQNNPLFVISGLTYNWDEADRSAQGQLSVEITASRFTPYPY